MPCDEEMITAMLTVEMQHTYNAERTRPKTTKSRKDLEQREREWQESLFIQFNPRYQPS